MKKIELFIALSLMLIAPFANGQDFYKMFGAEEEMTEDDWLRLEALKSSPVNINKAGQGVLVSCGLFSPYQVASLLDYRAEHGPVLSVAELALLDGFGSYFATAVAPFIIFETTNADAAGKFKGKADARYGVKGETYSWMSRFRLSVRGVEAGGAAKATYSARAFGKPSAWAFYAAGKAGETKWVAGDFNLRFGQGLAMWSGLTFTGVSSPLSIYKRATGLSGTTSCSGASQRGAAFQRNFGKWQLTGFLTERPGANLSLFLPTGQLGLTAFAKGTVVSVDGRFCLRGIDLFSELACEPSNKGLAFTGGAVAPVGDRGRLGLSLRYFGKDYKGKAAGAVRAWSKTSDEAGVALSYGLGELSISADAVRRPSNKRRQVKVNAVDAFQLSKCLILKLKAQYRWHNFSRPYYRSELRVDFCFTLGDIYRMNIRLHGTQSYSWGALSYIEGGTVTEDLGLWLRLTAFHADSWHDRLYCYERDAPGSFLVPAYYKRGGTASVYIKKKGLGKGITLYARASCTAYTNRLFSWNLNLLAHFDF